MTNEICWRSPSNIALIKYWGKRWEQLPMNPSLSMTLKKSYTETHLRFTQKENTNSEISFDFNFNGHRNAVFEKNIRAFLTRAQEHFNFIKNYYFEIHSSNNFPHSAGIASSASSMSSLALCLCSMEKQIFSNNITKEDFEQRAAFLSRLGSGSATRSIYGGYVIWGATDSIPGSSDEFAVPLPTRVHKEFLRMCDSVLVVSSKAKKMSSSVGHKLMETNPYAEVRYQVARSNLSKIIAALSSGSENSFVDIVENEAFNLHALFLTSTPGYILALPATFEIIAKIKQFRNETGFFVCFTLDAGPNIHLLYPKSIQKEVHDFIISELQNFCEEGFWIDDEVGEGPVQVF